MKARLALVTGICMTTVGCTGLPVLPSASAQQPAQPVVQQSSNSEVLQALADMQALKAEVQQLRDTVERQQFELEKLKSRQTDLYADLDQRLRVRERTGGSVAGGGVVTATTPTFSNVNVDSGTLPPTAQGTTPTVGGTQATTMLPSTVTVGANNTSTTTIVTQPATLDSTDGQVGTSQPSVGQVNSNQATGTQATGGQVITIQPATTLQPSTTVQPAGTTPVAVASAAPTVSAQDSYDLAFGLLKQSRYNDAVAAFETFVQTWPATDLTDDAYYWMAEARYVTRDFENALNGFRIVTATFPESQRIPASYLKIGYIQYEIGEYVDARETLSFILKNFPTHRVAVSAETRLKKMDREGR